MERTKIGKLTLNKETISNLSRVEQNSLKGGTNTFQWTLTLTLSHFDPANCINGLTGSNCSYCVCESGLAGQNSRCVGGGGNGGGGEGSDYYECETSRCVC